MIIDSSSVDWKNPDYKAIAAARVDALEAIRRRPQALPSIKQYYRFKPWEFISDWGVTFEPRNPEIGLPAYIPFVLFDKQIEWCRWVVDLWQNRRSGLCEKSRDVGISWLAMSLACTLCLFNRGMAIGVGSRKAEYVDKLGTMKPLLPKARIFMEHLPVEFRGHWEAWRDAPSMRIMFPETGSIIGGEGGDDIGRGDRTGLYLVDEYAHFERAELTEMSLSQTTNCRIDMSSVRGMNNAFARKRWGGQVPVFVFAWQDDPRKDDAWYKKQQETYDPVVVAQEIDRDYMASVEGLVCPGKWVQACVDAHKKLGIAPSGNVGIAFDVADEGRDKNAVIVTKGVSIESCEEWSGKGGDIFGSVVRVFDMCEENSVEEFLYDSDGLGAGVRGDARIINDQRKERHQRPISAIGWRGSESVVDPDGIVDGTIGPAGDKGRTNQDYFANRKAQGWWAMRRRVQKTYRWVVEGIACMPDDILNISSRAKNFGQLTSELSQPTFKVNGAGKIVIDKAPDGMPSPNLADCAMIKFAPKEPRPVQFTPQVLEQLRRAGRRG